MFYKHWKKLALALTGFFWASCDSNTASPVAPEEPASSDSNTTSSSAVASSSSVAPSSSSSETAPSSSGTDFEGIVPLYGVKMSATVLRSSSSKTESSSSFETPAPAYGVYDVHPCFIDGKGVKTNGEISETKLKCMDGTICKEREITRSQDLPCTPTDEGDINGAVVCPAYGIVFVTERTYDCDGVTYNEAEFLSHYYKKEGTFPESSSSAVQSSSSTAPQKIKTCYKKGRPEVTCEDGTSYTVTTDERGNTVYENEYGTISEKEFLKDHQILDEAIAMYGSPCYFDGTCRSDK